MTQSLKGRCLAREESGIQFKGAPEEDGVGRP